MENSYKQISEINPYDRSLAEKLFVGYDDLREDILAGISDNQSYAIFGGPACGKTVLLRQIEHDIRRQMKSFEPLRPIPRYCDITSLVSITPGSLFKTFYTLLTQSCQAPKWSDGTPQEGYQAFLDNVELALPVLEKHYGKDWVLMLLLDDIDMALAELPDDQFFYDLQDLLTTSDYQHHFRLLVSGMDDLATLTFPEQSPLNFLYYDSLRVLDTDEIEEFILAGFPEGINRKAKRRLLRLTGGHPYLLQGLLESVWTHTDDIDETALKRAKKSFLKQSSLFENWMSHFSLVEHIIYQRIVAEGEEAVRIDTLHEELDESLDDDIDDGIFVLSYHGVIEDVGDDEWHLAGTMFRDWYQDHCPIPNIENVYHDLLDLQAQVPELSLDGVNRKTVEDALDTGVQELLKPHYEGQPRREVLIEMLNSIAEEFKRVRVRPETMDGFFEQARTLATELDIGGGYWFTA